MDVSEELADVGIAVRDDFIPIGQVRALLDCAHGRRGRGEFAAARVGAPQAPRLNSEIRGDRTCWLREPLFDPERSLLFELEQLRANLNRHLFLGLFELEAQYAWYAPGAQYLRHLDQPNGSRARRVSLLVYLNDHWDERDGGELELFDANSDGRRILPQAGRMVCFLSEGREHAVRPANRDRLSVAGWFRVRSEG